MNMRIPFALAGLMAAVTTLAATGQALAQDFKPRIVRFGYGLVDDSNQGRAARFFAKEVEKATGGKMKVRAIGNASLGSDTQMQQALIGGAQEMMVGSTATLVGLSPEMAIWDTPFLFSNVKEADAVLDGHVGEKVKAKLRVMQNNVFLDSFKALGANAVPLPFSELFTALETRAVDGQENPFNTVLSSKFYEVQKYLTVSNHVYSPWIVTVSKKWWDTLSPAEKKVLQDAAVKSREFERKDTREEAAKALADIKAKGMQVNELPAAEASRMRDKLAAVNAGIAKTVGQGTWDEVQAAVKQARAAK
jgi:TRAP-type C4-dicarboxylate transport system substrate-binding protein